jgi:predicted 2-oxoglutarate/Fe(II)-dependent dioxygenase YbiX
MAPVHGVYLREEFLPADLFARLHAYVLSAEGERAAVQRTSGARLSVADEVRRAWEVDLPDDLHDLLTGRIDSLRPDLETFFGVTLEPCDAVAAVRYPPGAFYRTHRDAGRSPDVLGLHRRAVSIVVFANTGAPHPEAQFTGGCLRLHELAGAPDRVCDIVPLAGTLVAFRSTQLHEVMPVHAGIRVSVVTWLLRSAEADATEHNRRALPDVGKRG